MLLPDAGDRRLKRIDMGITKTAATSLRCNVRVSAGLGALLTLVAAGFLLACTDGKATQTLAPPAAPVIVASVERKDVPQELRAIGAVEAYSTVSVRTQVTGELTDVHFREGQAVRKGDLLFELDKRQFQAAVRRAEGTLARDQAELANAQAQQRRYDALVKEGVISREQYDQIRTNADALEAAVRADKGALEDAKIQVTYSSIYSPINGQLGNLVVHQGNMVKANDNPALVTINQIEPIYVTFNVPEQFLAPVRRESSRGKLRVAAQPPDGGPAAVGALSFIDNAVDQSTGTIKLKAQFVNADRRLWPGQFANVTLRLGLQSNVIVVPSQAVQSGQAGTFVYVVKQDMTVDARPITTGLSSEGVSVVEKGLNAGEQVVVDGQLRLTPGAHVEVKSQVASSPTGGATQ
jgi:multidrug efflux system membrane fusion protein